MKHHLKILTLTVVAAAVIGCASDPIRVSNSSALEGINNTILLKVIPDKAFFGSASADFLNDEAALEEYSEIAMGLFKKTIRKIQDQSALKNAGFKRSDIIRVSSSNREVNIDEGKTAELLNRTGAESITVVMLGAQDSAYHGDKLVVNIGSFNSKGWIATWSDLSIVGQFTPFKKVYTGMVKDYLGKIDIQLRHKGGAK
jgi:hypothetical protein